MKTPGFTAEASIYPARKHYQPTGPKDTLQSSRSVLLAQLPLNNTGGNGHTCRSRCNLQHSICTAQCYNTNIHIGFTSEDVADCLNYCASAYSDCIWGCDVGPVKPWRL
jgi:uncharacterized protein YcgI (DUF1989 family)